MKSGGHIYILANRKNGALYIGSTSDLIDRIVQHKNKEIPGHTSKYSIDKLMYFEWYDSLEDMVERERELKEWKRYWKIKLIEKENPDWDDLFNYVLNLHGYSSFDEI